MRRVHVERPVKRRCCLWRVPGQSRQREAEGCAGQEPGWERAGGGRAQDAVGDGQTWAAGQAGARQRRELSRCREGTADGDTSSLLEAAAGGGGGAGGCPPRVTDSTGPVRKAGCRGSGPRKHRSDLYSSCNFFRSLKFFQNGKFKK